MRRFICLALIAALMPALPASAQDMPALSAESSIIMCAETGEVLYENAARERMLIASLTKIMTAVVVLENCGLNDKVRPDKRSAGIEGSSMYLSAGELYTVEELLYGMLLVSGNDAATALALHVSGSLPEFAALMNKKAAELGMTGSSFKNPSGLDEEGHYSTAYDMALLASYAMDDPVFARIVGTRGYTVGEHSYYNHNKLLWRCEGCMGVKTGYTKAAGRTLVSCAEREGARFICCTLNAPTDWRDHEALYSWAETEYDYLAVMDGEASVSVPVVCGEKSTIAVSPGEDVMALIPEGQECELFFDLPRFVLAGVKKGERAGTVRAVLAGRELISAPLYYTESVGIDESQSVTFWERLGGASALTGPYYLIGEKK